MALITRTTTISAADPTTTPGDGEETLKEWSSVIGITTAIIGNVLIALALNVQRYAHTRLQKRRARIKQHVRQAMKRTQSSTQPGTYGAVLQRENGHTVDTSGSRDHQDIDIDDDENEPLSASFQSEATDVEQGAKQEDEESTSYLKSPYWWLGQILIVLGEMGNFLAYGFAPASIVSPLGVVALISNCIIAPVMFHERFRQRDFWGVVIAVWGVITVVLSANQEETMLNPDDVWDAIRTMEFEIYLGVTIGLIFVLMWASPRYGRRTILIDLGLVGLFGKLKGLLKSTCANANIVEGGYTALATKGVSSMLSSTLWRAFARPVTYVLLLILLGTAVMQIRYVNKALQRFDSTQVIPIQFVLFTLCVIIGSAILYRDFEKTTLEQAAKFVGGCLLTFFGVFLITSGRKQQKDEEDVMSEVGGIDETIGLVDQDGNPTTSPQQVPSPTRSRRSSKLSKVSFQGIDKPFIQEPRETESTPNSFPESSPLREPLLAASPPRGVRTLSADAASSSGQAQAAAIHADRPVTPRTAVNTIKNSNRSRTFISPSPLSSTVTKVVQDAFLRDDDNALARQSSLRRIRSSIRASLFFDSDDESNGDDRNIDTQQTLVPTSESNLPQPTEESSSVREDETTRRRSRSFSETLSSLFRSKSKKKVADEDNEAGSSS